MLSVQLNGATDLQINSLTKQVESLNSSVQILPKSIEIHTENILAINDLISRQYTMIVAEAG